MDAAAGDATSSFAEAALKADGAVVYSNKAPLSRPMRDARGLWDAAAAGRVRYETTCGAGLPVISTLKSLLATGDRVIEIVGCLSGHPRRDLLRRRRRQADVEGDRCGQGGRLHRAGSA